jgi:hypothetical protein
MMGFGHVPTGSIRSDGHAQGRWATALAELTARTQKLDIASVFADDHRGFVFIRKTASRPDGATLDIDEVHVLAIDDEGRVTDLWDLSTDPAIHDRFFDGE